VSRDIPILFSAPMVRANLAGTKTQTRRVVKHPAGEGKHGWNPTPTGWDYRLGGTEKPVSPYGKAGDRLYVREAWRAPAEFDPFKPSHIPVPGNGRLGTPIVYEASRHESVQFGKLRPGMFMPRWASRTLLLVKEVRIERLQAISEADAQAEGCALECMTPTGDDSGSAIHGPGGYIALWESINGAGSWAANPWVWVVTYERITP